MKIKNLVGSLPHSRTKHYSIRATGFIEQIVVHHSGRGSTPDGLKTIQAAARYHVAPKPIGNGWPGIGYHYAVAPDGSVYKLNNMTTLTYHAGPGENKRSLGVVVLGDFREAQPTPAALSSLRTLLRTLLAALPGRRVVGHRDVRQTACPGDKLYELLPWLTAS